MNALKGLYYCKRVGCLVTPTVNNTKSYILQLSAEGNSHNWEYIAVALCTESIGEHSWNVE